MAGRYRFEGFLLDLHDRRLRRHGVPVELSGRYLDALALMVAEPGRLVSKDRFMEEVWRGVPVTDEALTQCIRSLRRALGDEAGRPRFIETVPKHGYRFIAPVEAADADPPEATAHAPSRRPRLLPLAGASALGGGLAGVFVGLFYGFAGSLQPGAGALSAVLVLVCLSIGLGMLAAAGIGLGIAAAALAPDRRWQWSVLGGAAGGLVLGALAKLLGLDAFELLFGRSPGDITGAAEGALVGAAVGLAVWLGGRRGLRPGIAVAALAGGLAGALIPLLGGRLLGGSLDLLARGFPESRLRLLGIGGWFGEVGFGPITQTATAALEGAVFAACVVAVLLLARRSPRPPA